MRTDIEHLLTPRFEVIADYPNSRLSIGTIICNNIHKTCFKVENNDNFTLCEVDVVLHDYPNLFKPLKWWEKRTEDEMPMYLKINNVKLKLSGPNFSYYKVLKWHMNSLFAQVEKDRMSGCSLHSFNPEYTYQPCSEQEYLNNVK